MSQAYRWCRKRVLGFQAGVLSAATAPYSGMEAATSYLGLGCQSFSVMVLTRSHTPVKPALDWRQFVSIKGLEFDGQLAIAEIAVIGRGYGRFGSV
ncbi:TPA: hypothetical protein ACG47G_006687, partial [Pseudomonas aeruginosa]